MKSAMFWTLPVFVDYTCSLLFCYLLPLMIGCNGFHFGSISFINSHLGFSTEPNFFSSNKNFSFRDLLAEYAKEIQDPENKVRRHLKLC